MAQRTRIIKKAIERKLYKLLEMIHLQEEGQYNEIVQDIQEDLDCLEHEDMV